MSRSLFGSFFHGLPLLALLPATGLSAQDRAAPPSLHDFSASLEALSTHVRQSVVQVFSVGYAPVDDSSDSDASDPVVSKQHSTGSGIVVSADGYLVTNAHVVLGARRIQVKLPPSEAPPANREAAARAMTKIDAKLVGLDHETDIAVLKVDRTGLQPLEFGNSDELRQGQLVLAFGNPFGLEGSVSLGIVSSVSRQIRPDDTTAYIQTDAPINPGNSGGPLVDDSGRLVGVNTLILSQSGGSEGIGFAVPSNLVQAIYTQIRKDGHVHRGQIGIYAQSITPTLASGLALPQNWGVVVSDVEPDSPASDAGVEVGDIISAIDGRTVENLRQLELAIFRHSPNDRAHIRILRGHQTLELAVRVIEREDDPERFADLATSEDNLVPKLGILGVTIDRKLSDLLPDLRAPGGVVVAALSPDADPDATGLETGDVIHSVNTHRVSSIAVLNELLKDFNSGDSVVLQIERDDRLMFLTVEME